MYPNYHPPDAVFLHPGDAFAAGPVKPSPGGGALRTGGEPENFCPAGGDGALARRSPQKGQLPEASPVILLIGFFKS